MRAVTKLIVGAGITGNEALVPDHARLSPRPAIQIRMAADAAVNHRDSNAGAGVARLPGRERIHRWRSIAESRRKWPVQADVYDIRLVREVHDAVAIKHRNQTIDQGQLRQDRAAKFQNIVDQAPQQT